MFDLRNSSVWIEFDGVAAPTSKYEDGEVCAGDLSFRRWVEVEKAASLSICVNVPTTLLLPDWDALACTLTLDDRIAFTWQISLHDLCKFKPYRISHVELPGAVKRRYNVHRLKILEASAEVTGLPDVKIGRRVTASKSSSSKFAEQLGCIGLELHRVKLANFDRHRLNTTMMHVEKLGSCHDADLIKKTKAWQISFTEETVDCPTIMRGQKQIKGSEARASWQFFYRSARQLEVFSKAALNSRVTETSDLTRQAMERPNLPLSDESFACAGSCMLTSTSETSHGDEAVVQQQRETSEYSYMSTSDGCSTTISPPRLTTRTAPLTTPGPSTSSMPTTSTGLAIDFPELTACDRLALWLIAAELAATTTQSAIRDAFIAFADLPGHRHFTPHQWRLAWEQTVGHDWDECQVQAEDKQKLFQHADTIEPLNWEGRQDLWNKMTELDTYEHLTAKQWEWFWLMLVRPVWMLDREAAEKEKSDEGAAENKAAENKAAENKAAEKKAAEKKAAEEKAAEKKAAEKKAAERKIAEEKIVAKIVADATLMDEPAEAQDEMEGVGFGKDAPTNICTPAQPLADSTSSRPLFIPTSPSRFATMSSPPPPPPPPISPVDPPPPPPPLSPSQAAPMAPITSAPNQPLGASQSVANPILVKQAMQKPTQPNPRRSILRPASRLPSLDSQPPTTTLLPALPTPERPYISAYSQAFNSKGIFRNTFMQVVDVLTYREWRDSSTNETEKREFADWRAALGEEDKATILWDREAMAKADALLENCPEDVEVRNATWEVRDLWCWWQAKRKNASKDETAKRRKRRDQSWGPSGSGKRVRIDTGA